MPAVEPRTRAAQTGAPQHVEPWHHGSWPAAAQAVIWPTRSASGGAVHGDTACRVFFGQQEVDRVARTRA